MGNSRNRGMALAAGTAVISGFAVFANGYGVRKWGQISDATTYTTLKNLVAAAILVGFAGIITRRRWSDGLVAPRRVKHWLGLVAIAAVGGSLPFVLFFEGLSRASSSQAAFIHKTLVVWVALMAVRLLGERLGALHLVAIAMLVAGQVLLVGGIGEIQWGAGEAMILLATLLWSLEIVVAKRLLAELPSTTIGLGRMVGGSVLLVGYAMYRGALGGLSGVSGEHVLWILLTGAVLAAYVGTWFAALARAPAVDVTAVLVGGAVITALLRTGLQGLTLPPVAGLALVAAGVGLAALAGARRSLAWR